METDKDLLLLTPINRTSDTQLFITQRAMTRLIELHQEETHDSSQVSRFRIRVDSGGCAGFQYFFNFDTLQQADDVIFHSESVDCIVDEISLTFLNQVILDYVEGMMGASFQLKNPNASSACGCGNSFSP